jgi:hypothetical protein
MTVRIDRPKPVTVLSPVTRETTTLSESYTKYINTNLETNFNVHQKHAHKRSNEMVDRLTLPIESFYIYWETHHNKQNSNLLSWGQQFKKKEIRYVPFAIQREKVLVCISASTMKWQYLPTLSRLDEREFESVLWVLGLGTAGDFGNKIGMGFSLGGWTLFRWEEPQQ